MIRPVLMGLPAAKIARYMREGGVEATPEEVSRLWELYRQGVVEKGFAPYIKETGAAKWGDVFNWIVAAGIPKAKVAAFLNALERSALKDGDGFEWVDPVGAASAQKADTEKKVATAGSVLAPVKAVTGSIGEAAGALLAPTLDPVTNLVKYAALTAVVAGGAYLVFKFSKG